MIYTIIFNPSIDYIVKVKEFRLGEILYYGKKLLEKGAQNVIVSMAGDSLIGGFLAHYSANFDIVQAFKWGVATGSATAFSMDLCSRSDVEALIKEVVIAKLS